MKSLAFFALSAIATAAMAGPVAAPPAMGTISITGTSSQTHLEENLAVAEINIPDATMAVLEAIGADGTSH